MSTQIENYLIYGIKLNSEFTHYYRDEEFRDAEEWSKEKPSNEPFFITDGMCGEYTFFGFITQLSNGWDESEEQEIKIPDNKCDIISKFHKLYPDSNISDEEVKMYFLPHWV